MDSRFEYVVYVVMEKGNRAQRQPCNNRPKIETDLSNEQIDPRDCIYTIKKQITISHCVGVDSIEIGVLDD